MKSLLLAAFLLLGCCAAKRHHPRPHGDDAPLCELVSHTYIPSKLEDAWQARIASLQDSTDAFCAAVAEQEPQLWSIIDAVNKSSSPSGGYSTLPGLASPPPLDIMSQHAYQLNCSDGLRTVAGTIEPLVGGLRHPLAGCKNLASKLYSYPDLIVARTYIAFDGAASPKLRLQPRPRAKLLFDMGARTWPQGLGVAQQPFLIDSYMRNGISFDRMLLWEAKQMNGNQIFAKVPRELLAKYQYFNIPVDTNFSDPGHPFSVLKQLARPADYVAMKIDIDSPQIEKHLFQQIASDPELYERIDELFYEPHVSSSHEPAVHPASRPRAAHLRQPLAPTGPCSLPLAPSSPKPPKRPHPPRPPQVKFAPMLPIWTEPQMDMATSMADMYRVFASLRARGVRVHGWP